MGPVSKGDKVALLENGTVKADKVALRDLAFWLPYTGEYLGKVDITRIAFYYNNYKS